MAPVRSAMPRSTRCATLLAFRRAAFACLGRRQDARHPTSAPRWPSMIADRQIDDHEAAELMSAVLE